MKKFFSLLVTVFLVSLNMSGQENNDSTSTIKNVNVDSLLVDVSGNVAQIASQGYAIEPGRGRYKMYLTENIYNLLKLDTATGQIKQVQWSLKRREEMTLNINSSYLSYTGKIGTFELYPTNNMYQFILLDTTDGRTWHVQWGTESKKRWIRRIY